MSIKVMAEVWRRDIKGSEQLLLLALADHADDNGEHVFPSVALMAWKCGYSVRNVQLLLKRLRAKRVILVVNPAYSGRPTEYKINLDALPLKKPFVAPIKVTPEMRRHVISVFGYVCQYCGATGDDLLGPDNIVWEIDRMVPGSQGGNYTNSNVTLSCHTCNRRKGAKIAPRGTLSLKDMDATLSDRGAKSDNTPAKAVAPEPSIDTSPKPVNEKESNPSPYDLSEYLRRKSL